MGEEGRGEEALEAWGRYAAQGRSAEVYARARRGLLLWRLGREEEAQEDLAWAWKRRRRLDARVREQLRAVRREMRRWARQEQAERERPGEGAEETGAE